MIGHGHLIQDEKDKYLKYLETHGLKLTKGREEVLEEILKTHGHFAAEELVKRCRVRHRRASRATIYRSLRELREAAVIRETAFGEKHLHFEHVYDEILHHHARCLRCYKIIEIPCHHEDKKYIKILDRHGFKTLGHEMHFYGLCRMCRNKPS